jgi:alpha-N-arabinofuranosidase
VFSGITLDIFHQHPETIAMANCAQLINCLNSLYLAHEDKFCITPVGHVFDMYSAHQGGLSLRSIFSAPAVHYDRDGKPASFWGLQGSASLHDKDLVLTVVNPHVNEPREAEVVIRGASVQSGFVTVLTHSDIHAHNSLDQKDMIQPQTKALEIRERSVTHTFSPASVTKLALRLA